VEHLHHLCGEPGADRFSLADPASGKAGAVVTDQDNGGTNQTLATLGTLANLVSLCAAAQSPQCRRVPPAQDGSSLVGGHRRVRPGLGGRLRHAPRLAALRR
jgi:hypothetical protein